jgi:hypothetical protein
LVLEVENWPRASNPFDELRAATAAMPVAGEETVTAVLLPRES